MTMDNTEIKRNYQQAKDKKRQLSILADLNQCDVGRIVSILEEQGEKVDRRWLGKNGRSKPTAEQEDQPEGESLITLSKADAKALGEYLNCTLEDYIADRCAAHDLDMKKLHVLSGLCVRCRMQNRQGGKSS